MSISFVFILWIINKFKIIFEKPVLRFNRFKIGRFSGFYFKQNRPSLVDNGILLRFSHCTNEGINTQRVLGTSCCSMTVDWSLENFATTNLANVNSALDDAIKNEQLLILMIDDYTTVHSKRRPNDLKTSKAKADV